MASTSKSPAPHAKRKSKALAFPVEFGLRIVKSFRVGEVLKMRPMGIQGRKIKRPSPQQLEPTLRSA